MAAAVLASRDTQFDDDTRVYKSCSRCNCMCCIRFTLPTAASAAAAAATNERDCVCL